MQPKVPQAVLPPTITNQMKPKSIPRNTGKSAMNSDDGKPHLPPSSREIKHDVSVDESFSRRPQTQGHAGKGGRKRLNPVTQHVRLLSNNDAASNSRAVEELHEGMQLTNQEPLESLDEIEQPEFQTPASEKKKSIERLRNTFLYDQLSTNPRDVPQALPFS